MGPRSSLFSQTPFFFIPLIKLILDEEIFCPPEAAVLLASYALHVKVCTLYMPGIEREEGCKCCEIGAFEEVSPCCI
jgi:hypothetical protein